MVAELISPEPGRRAASLLPGQKMLVWYDPEDPHDVQVCGRKGRPADQAFVAAGVAFMLAGAGFRVHPLTGAPGYAGAAALP